MAKRDADGAPGTPAEHNARCARRPRRGNPVSPHSMFNPTKDEVRRFFIDAWKRRDTGVLTPLETLALNWIEQHPEYHDDLEADDALGHDYAVEAGRSNPFLHLSMHLSISEQVSIDQPAGIRQACQLLSARRGEHEAHHAIMECLGQMLWTAQRSGLPPDGESYVDCVRRAATRD